MRLVLLLVTALCMGTAAVGAQSAPAPGQGQPPAQADSAARSELPVSLDRIRDALARENGRSLLTNVERKADFTVQVEEQARIDEIMARLDFSSGPAPAGGLYMYEQQQRLFSSTRPLQRPYAAFNGGQLLTIALQNLIGRYVAGQTQKGIAAARQSGAERDAREEVDQAIAEYCASRPDRHVIKLCTDQPPR
jgi:hypothetical protein